MKTKTQLLVLALLFMSYAKATDLPRARNNPNAPLQIICTQPDGTQEIVRVMSLLYRDGFAPIGMHFGPDRGDEGFYKLRGECEVTMGPQIQTVE